MFVLIVLCIIYGISGYETEIDAHPAKDVIASMQECLMVFFAEFNKLKIVTELGEQLILRKIKLPNNSDFKDMSTMVKKVNDLTRDAATRYIQAAHPLYTWCNETVNNDIETHKKNNETSFDGQKRYLSGIILTNLEKSDIALDRLSKLYLAVDEVHIQLDSLVRSLFRLMEVYERKLDILKYLSFFLCQYLIFLTLVNNCLSLRMFMSFIKIY